MRQRIFVGSSREAIDVCRLVQAELDDDDHELVVWDQGVFRLSHGSLESLLDTLDTSDAGIFILRGDDLTKTRDQEAETVRDNVLLELGMFIGRLGRDRAIMMTPKGSAAQLPSDLLGLTTAEYRVGAGGDGPTQSGVGPACTKIRNHLGSLERRVTEEPESRGRLDRAMVRLSRDLESLLGGPVLRRSNDGEAAAYAERQIGRAVIRIEVGKIQDIVPEERGVVALPANEYFDDECVTDGHSSLGAFVQHHFPEEQLDDFLASVRGELAGFPTQLVPRAERRIEHSYGIGRAIFLSGLAPQHSVILVSATTERTGIGLRAEPHFLYAAVQGVLETMNSRRLNSVVMPVFGAGHGGMPLTVALLFNVLALRSCLNDGLGVHLKKAVIVVYAGRADEITNESLEDVLARALAV